MQKSHMHFNSCARQACKEGNMMKNMNSLNIPTNHLTNLRQHHSHVYSIIASRLLGFSSAIESSHEAESEWHRVHLDLNAWLGSHSSEMIFIESVTLRWACSLISSLIAHSIWTDVELAGSGHIQGLWDVSTLDHLSRKALSRATVRLI